MMMMKLTLLMRDIVMVGDTAFLSKTGDMYVNLHILHACNI